MPPQAIVLLEDVGSEAKRWGHPVPSVLHLCRLLARREPLGFAERFGPSAVSQLELCLGEMSDPQEAPAAGEDPLVDLISEASAKPGDLLKNLYDAIEPTVIEVCESPTDDDGDDGPRPDSPVASAAATAGALSGQLGRGAHPAAFGRVHTSVDASRTSTNDSNSASAVSPSPPDGETAVPIGLGLPPALDPVCSLVVPVEQRADFRAEVLDEVLAGLATERPALIALAGRPGSGRTTVLSELAAALDTPEAPESVRGRRLARVDCRAVLRLDRLNTVRRLVDLLPEDVVLCFDDLELLANLSSPAPDLDIINLIFSISGDAARRIIAVIDSPSLTSLFAQNRAVERRIHVVHQPEVRPEQLDFIVREAAEAIENRLGVTIGADVLEVACSPARLDGLVAHPGLALDRLDAAVARARVAGRSHVEIADLQLGRGVGGPRMLDAAQIRADVASKIVGQVGAVDRIVSRLALTFAHLDLNPYRPDGVFLFLGPTGVGKTALARSISEELFGPDTLIRLDMSEYAHEWAIARLIGPQPGYVGYTEPQGWLTTRVRERPQAVVLLDEIEKAHPVVWNTFLQVFDAGRLTDARGAVADFSQAVIVMTSNLGAEHFGKPAVGFRREDGADTAVDRVLETLRNRMSPELINRIDEVAVFDPLSEADISKITRLEVNRVAVRLRDRGLLVHVDDPIIDHLALTGYSPAYGARHVQRNIERVLLSSLIGLAPGTWRALLGDDGSVSWTTA